MTKVKICGLQYLQEIDYVNELKPDYIGFAFAKSRWQITKEHAITLSMSLDDNITSIGVFVDETAKIVGSYAEHGVIDMIQLHGQENEAYLAHLRDFTEHEIIQAFSIQSEDDIKRAMESSADYILLDSQNPGSGVTFDWCLVNQIPRPFFLAGGLTPENVTTAINRLQPYAVDVCSGVEEKGVKNKEKIASFIRRIRHV